MFKLLRGFYSTGQIPFTFVSDELNGINCDNQSKVRPLWLRNFATLTEAMQDNAGSRIYLGVHFRFDVDNGVTMGRQVADYMLKRGGISGSLRLRGGIRHCAWKRPRPDGNY